MERIKIGSDFNIDQTKPNDTGSGKFSSITRQMELIPKRTRRCSSCIRGHRRCYKKHVSSTSAGHQDYQGHESCQAENSLRKRRCPPYAKKHVTCDFKEPICGRCRRSLPYLYGKQESCWVDDIQHTPPIVHTQLRTRESGGDLQANTIL
jgi:hypothetical protein